MASGRSIRSVSRNGTSDRRRTTCGGCCRWWARRAWMPSSTRRCRAIFAKPSRSASDRRCPNPNSWPKCARSPRATASMVSLIGQGYYGTHLPPVIQRNVLENPAWYTAYTPYQAEISQGRLEALLNFQTMIADLTGLEIANASLLDEATAAAEAMAMARRVSPSQASAFFVDQDCHPQTVAVIQTRAEPLGWTVVVGDPATDLDPAAVFGAILQYPGSSGGIRDYRDVIRRLHAADASGDCRSRSARADAAHVSGRARRGHRDWLHAAFRRAQWAMAARTPRSLRQNRPFSGRCRAASSA